MNVLDIIDVKYTAGARFDCNKLIEKFLGAESLRYEEFSAIWREMNMSYIFYGRIDFRELLEFTETLLNMSKNVWLNSSDDEINLQVGGFYLTYAFYMKQPMRSQASVKIRLTLSDWEKCQSFVSYLLDDGHWDAYYLFCKLMTENAFYYVFQKTVTYFGKSPDKAEEKKSTVLYKSRLDILNSQTFKVLQSQHDIYENQKKEFLPLELHSADPNLMHHITEASSSSHKSNEDLTSTSAVVTKTDQDIGSRRNELKRKLFATKLSKTRY